MKRFLIWRLVGLIVILILASLLIFGSMYLTPGSATSVLFGVTNPTPAVRKAVTAYYHLNDPFIVQYWHWLIHALQGNFGNSIVFNEPVVDELAAAGPTTAELTAYAAVLIVLFGIGMGVVAALRPGLIDNTIILMTTVGVGLPSFVAAIILISVFSVDLKLFPVLGTGSGSFGSAIYHLTLPAVALAVWSCALVTRITRASVIDELRREYVETARSRGLPWMRTVRRHVVRNAIGPIATVAGLQIAGLLSGAIIIEEAFGLHGLGSLLLSSVEQKDFPTVQAVALLFVATFVVVNAITDVLYAVLDPRIRLGGQPA